jgi:hypothetical protein
MNLKKYTVVDTLIGLDQSASHLVHTIYEDFLDSPQGKFITENKIPIHHYLVDEPASFGMRVILHVEATDQQWMMYKLSFGNRFNNVR